GVSQRDADPTAFKRRHYSPRLTFPKRPPSVYDERPWRSRRMPGRNGAISAPNSGVWQARMRSMPATILSPRQLLLCLILTGTAYLLTLAAWPLSQRFPFALFLAAVLVSAWTGGPASALFTTMLSTLSLSLLYYQQSPTNKLDLVLDQLPRLM